MTKIIRYSTLFIITFIIFSIFILYLSLLKGISIKDLNYNLFNIKELYIKIDKKIILKAQNIDISYKNTSSSNEKINFHKSEKLLKKTLQYLSFFQEINVQNISINKNKINKIYFENNHFILNTPNLEFDGNIYPDKNNFLFKINTLNLKDYHFIIHNIKGNFYSDLIHLYININSLYNEAQIKLHLKITNKYIKYHGDIFNITKNTLKYLDKNVSFIKNLEIYNVHIKGDNKYAKIDISNIKLNTNNLLSLNIPKIKANINIKNLQNSIHIPQANIKYDNIKITPIDIQASYNKNTIYASSALIDIKQKNILLTLLNNHIKYNLNKNNLNISNNLNLTTNNIKGYSSNIQTNLNMNNLKINSFCKTLTFKEKNTTINLLDNNISYKNNIVLIKNKLKLKHKNIDVNSSIIDTKIDIKNSQVNTNIDKLNINNITANKLNLSFKNNILHTNFNTSTLFSKELTNILKLIDLNIPVYQITGTNFTKAKIDYDFNKSKLNLNLNIKTKNSKLLLAPENILYIHNGNIIVTQNELNITNSNVDYNKSIVNANYDINTSSLNFNTLKMDIYGKFNELNITNIADIKNYPENIFIDLNNDIKINFQNLKTDILINNQVNIIIKKLSILYPYIKYLKDYKIYDGFAKIVIDKNVFIHSHLLTNQPIVEKKLTPLKKLDINTTIDDKNIYITNNDINISILNYAKKIYSIDGVYKNLDLNLSSIIDSPSQSNSQKPNVKLKASNSYIIYHNSKLYSDTLKLDFNSSTKAGNIISIYKDRNFTIHYQDNKFKLYGTNIKSKTLDDIVKISFFKEPLLDLFLVKYRNSSPIVGHINIKQGYIKGLAAFNNIIAFINLIPSLLTFQPAGFTTKGYIIDNGYIRFIYYNKVIYIKTFTINGENITFNGSGYINLKNNTIDMKVDVNLLIKLVKDIPVLGYILLGKDGGVTLSLTVSGALNNPTIHKHTMSNILNAPLGIVKRILITPMRPFIKEEK